MESAQQDPSSLQSRLRLWPGVLIVVVQCLARFVVPILVPEAMAFGAIGGLAGGLAVVVWWAFFSRAPWGERLGGVVLMVAALFVAQQFLHESLATGAMGMLYFMYAVPLLSLAFVAWAVVSHRLSGGSRRLAMVATVVVACGVWTLLQTGGITGSVDSDFSWRWAQTPEERLLAQGGDEPMGLQTVIAEAVPAEWPGFRGPNRDGVVAGVTIATDWSASPPLELWRRPIGPGWSSFAVRGDLAYTQEQRGEDEVVSCYRLSTGEPVWRHRDAARFWESNAGAGPRATPTLHEQRVYTFGATGIVNALDAQSGALVWSRNAASDASVETPMWGFSGSPLVVDDIVVVAASGTLVGYAIDTGDLSWTGPSGGASYSSPHPVTLDGVDQVLLQSAAGTTSVMPGDGDVLWTHEWKGYPIVQPAQAADGDLLINASEQSGLRRLSVEHGSNGWSAEERWTSKRLKPYFNDFVVREGHAYGFDGSILASVSLADGQRKWKGGRYGHGQLLLLRDQGLLLVQSEGGELALLEATPSKFTELARSPAIEGKSWNHPVLAGDVLLVRNDQEMGAFRLPVEEAAPQDPTRITQVP